MCEVGSYRMVALLKHFYQAKPFVYSINYCADKALKFKEVYFVNISLSIKYNKTLNAMPLCLYKIAFGESLLINIVLGFTSC